MLIEATNKLRVGNSDDDDFGPVINKRQLDNMLAALTRAKSAGAVVLTGGHKLDDDNHRQGFYIAPTVIENTGVNDEISTTELFGPIACLYHVRNFAAALECANNSPYGLTACIHTSNVNRAMEFVQKVQSGVTVVNAGT